jgi:formate dehydrogenase iron-sulfur subunit
MRRLCMHCEKPACASVCPVGALHKTSEGPVVYDVWKCIGCRYCMVACVFCPAEVRMAVAESAGPQMHYVPRPHRAGKPTACAEICPTGATKFGERDDLIREAKDRIRQNPSNYVNRIYGLNEVGGTSVFILSERRSRIRLSRVGQNRRHSHAGIHRASDGENPRLYPGVDVGIGRHLLGFASSRRSSRS